LVGRLMINLYFIYKLIYPFTKMLLVF
jgi:hypothetical protein